MNKANVGGIVLIFIGLALAGLYLFEKQSTRVLRLTLGHDMPIDSPQHRGAMELKRILVENSGGTVDLEIFPNQELGNDLEMVNLSRYGKLDIIMTPTSKLTWLVPDFMLLDLPYLFASREEAYTLLDGEFGKSIKSGLNDFGLVPVSYWESGFKQFSSRFPVAKTAPFNGTRVRVMQSPILAQMIHSLDAFVVYADFKKLPEVLANGDVDGQENPLASFAALGLSKLQPHIMLSNHGYLTQLVSISQKTNENLTSDQQYMLISAIKEATKFQRLDAYRTELKVKKKLESEVNFYEPSEDQVKELKDRFGNIYQRHQDLIKKHSPPESVLDNIPREGYLGIAINLSMSTLSKDSALAIIRGVRLGVAELNQQGGIGGNQVYVSVWDHGGSPGRGKENVAIISKGKYNLGIVGGMHSPVVLAERQVIYDSKIPYLVPWAAASDIIEAEKNPWIFRFSIRDSFAGEFLVNNDEPGVLVPPAMYIS